MLLPNDFGDMENMFGACRIVSEEARISLVVDTPARPQDCLSNLICFVSVICGIIVINNILKPAMQRRVLDALNPQGQRGPKPNSPCNVTLQKEMIISFNVGAPKTHIKWKPKFFLLSRVSPIGRPLCINFQQKVFTFRGKCI